MKPGSNDPRRWTPEPYIPLFQAILGIEGDARTLALRGEAGDTFKPAGVDAFTFEMSDDIGEFLEKEWLVQDWLGVNETSQFVGEPSAGKSTLVASLAVHVAAGRVWFGKPVMQGGVVYFAGERVELTRRRVKGLQRFHNIPNGQPLAVASGPLDICKPESVRAFIEGVNRFEDRTDQTPALVVIDTFSRVYVGSEENDASAMSAAYAHVDQIRRESGAHVLLVHHSGVSVDAKRRGRGSSVQTGAIDTGIVVTKAGRGGCAEIVKQNDGEEGLKIVWDLESFVVATNSEGKETTVPIPVSQPLGNLGGRFVATPLAVKALSPGPSAALASLRQAIDASGIASDGTAGFPAVAPTVSREQFREAFYRDDTVTAPDATPATRRKRFNRGLEDLEKAGRIGVLGDRVWLIG
jgi:AAA domain